MATTSYTEPFRPSAIGPEADHGQLRFYGLKTEDDMVYLALTPQGLRDILDASEAAEPPVWCSADALSARSLSKATSRETGSTVTIYAFSALSF